MSIISFGANFVKHFEEILFSGLFFHTNLDKLNLWDQLKTYLNHQKQYHNKLQGEKILLLDHD